MPPDGDAWTIHHYTFIDATGAEYRLYDDDYDGKWESSEAGAYMSYDPASLTLWFPNGTRWYFGCLSEGMEEDAGTRYPTWIADSNGNWIGVLYLPGDGTMAWNTSARIASIEDVRAVYNQWTEDRVTYEFEYDATDHLIEITNRIDSGEEFELDYATNHCAPPSAIPAMKRPRF